MGKTALITGGTGSFGQVMLSHLLSKDYDVVRIFSRDEDKQHALRIRLNDERVQYLIGDVRDRDRILSAMSGVDHVFHAAALKQVPSCEFFPMEAVRTNIIGSQNMIDAAVERGVEKVVVLSTDKAVFPVNAMGMSKAMMEKLVSAQVRLDPGCATTFCTVRYGNVMGSRGSVIPLFVEKILNDQPLTITDPEMTRFLLPLPLTVELVEHAFVHGKSGDIFIRKSPAAKMGDLAQALLELFESKAGISIIGQRVGEKVFETLATAKEIKRSKDEGEYFLIPLETHDLDYEAYYDKGDLDGKAIEDYHSHNTEQLDVEQTKEFLRPMPIIQEALKRIGQKRK